MKRHIQSAPPEFDALSGAAQECLGQLFTEGPTWDGCVVSKQARSELVAAGLAQRFNGWQQLTAKGLALAIDDAVIQRVRHWESKQWYKKACA